VCQLFIDFKEAYDSARKAELYNNHIEFRVSMKLVRLINTRMCVSLTYRKVRIGKYLSDNFSIINCLKEKYLILIGFQIYLKICH
jgi:hypothetical protein